MKFPLWLTTTVIAWGVLIPTKAQSQVVVNLSEQSTLTEQNNLALENTETYQLAKGFHRRFRRSRHGHFRRRRRGRFRGHRRHHGRGHRDWGHGHHRGDRRRHFNHHGHRNHNRRRRSGIFIKF